MQKKKVLIVEDDEFLRTLYFDLLKDKYEVDTAVDGNEAYEKMQKDGWDLILLDIILPKMDGISIIEKMKEEHPEVLKNKIIFLTNLDRNEMIVKVEKLGFSYIIKSDVNPDEFSQKVTSLLKK